MKFRLRSLGHNAVLLGHKVQWNAKPNHFCTKFSLLLSYMNFIAVLLLLNKLNFTQHKGKH